MKVRSKITCPTCRTISPLGEVKQDFKMQQFVDMHKANSVTHGIYDSDNKIEGECSLCQNKNSSLSRYVRTAAFSFVVVVSRVTVKSKY